VPVTACVKIVSSKGGRIADVHYENSNYGVVDDGSSNVVIENINTASTSVDSSTPPAMVLFCNSTISGPCTSGVAATNGKVTGLQRISPNVTTNAVVDQNNSTNGTISFASWNSSGGEYSQGSSTYGGNVSVAGSGTFSGGVSTGAGVPSSNHITGISEIDDVNGNAALTATATGSAVDYVDVTNAATANPATVTISAKGSDSNINLNFVSKGSGGVSINGGTALTSENGTDVKLQTGTGTFSASNMACGDANGGVTPCTTTPTGIVLGNGVTGTTQSQADNSTKVATTAYIDANTTVCNPGTFTSQTDGSTVTWAIASAKCANAALTFTTHGGSRTLNLTGLVTGGSYVLKLIQDGTGGENLTGGTGCTWKQAGGGGSTFTLTGTASAIDLLSFEYDGTNCLSVLTKGYN